MKYIIDFERLNELTVHPNDDPKGNTGFSVSYCYSTTRKLIKELMEIYTQYPKTNRITQEEYDSAVETLLYNNILVDKRDKKIDEVLKP